MFIDRSIKTLKDATVDGHLTVGCLVILFVFITPSLWSHALFNIFRINFFSYSVLYDILLQKHRNKDTASWFFKIITVECLYIVKGKLEMRSASAIPVLKSETVTSNLPNRLVIVGWGLSRQKKVLVEEALFVPFKLHCPTSHHEQRGLALGCLFCEWRKGRLMLDYAPSQEDHHMFKW